MVIAIHIGRKQMASGKIHGRKQSIKRCGNNHPPLNAYCPTLTTPKKTFRALKLPYKNMPHIRRVWMSVPSHIINAPPLTN